MPYLRYALAVFLIPLFLSVFFTPSVSAYWDCLAGSSCIGGRSTCDIDYPGGPTTPAYPTCENLDCGPAPNNPNCIGQCCRWIDPQPSPSPSPSCVQTPGSFASYDGCITAGYDRVNYYNCDGSTFSITYPNPECDYLNPLPSCDSGQVCTSCTLNASGNACSNNGVRSCVYTTLTTGGACEQVSVNQTCNVNNCSLGYSCVGGICISDGGGGGGGGGGGSSRTCNFSRSYNQCCAAGSSQNVDEYTWSDGSGICNNVVGACNQADPACTDNRTCNFNSSYNQCCAAGYSRYVNAGTWSDGSGDCWDTGICNQVDAACAEGVCNNNGAQDNGETGIDCGGGGCPACGGGETKYSCSSSACVVDPNGNYTSSTCDGSCSPPPPPPGGSLLCPVMHPFAQIRNVTKNQAFPTSVTYKGVTYDLTSPGACDSSGPNCGLAIESTAQAINASPGDVLELRAMVVNENERSGAIHSVELRFWGDKGITAYPNGLADDEAGNVGFCTNSYYNGLTNFANAGISCVNGGSMGCYPGVPWTAYTTDAKSSPGESQAWGTGVVSTNWNTARYQVPANVVSGTIAGITAAAFPNGGVQTPSGLCFWDWNGSQGNKDFRWKTDDPMCPFTNDMFYDSLPLTVNVVEPTVPICGYIKNFPTEEGISGVQVQVYDDNLGATRTSALSGRDGSWLVDKFVRPGDLYAVRIPSQSPPSGYIVPPKTSTYDYSWNFLVNPNPGTNPWADTPWGFPSYEGQKAGSRDCAGADGAGLTCRCNFVYYMDRTEPIPPPPIPDAVIGPWIQTTGGDVHSNTRINTPGGP